MRRGSGSRGRGALGVAWKVHRLRPSLAVIPAVGLLCLLVAVAGLILAAQGAWQAVVDGRSLTIGQKELLAAFVPVLVVVGSFFSAALYRAVDGVLRREPLPLGAVFLATARRLPVYALWGVLAQAVSVLEGLLAASWVLELLLMAFDFSWWAVTYFILPVMVSEGLGLAERTRAMLIFPLVTLALVAVPGALALIYGAESDGTSALLLYLGLACLWGVLVSALVTTVAGVFRMVVYHRALRQEGVALAAAT